MEHQDEFIATYMKLPTHLLELLDKDQDVILIYSKKKCEELTVTLSETMDASVANSTLNLTGTPLEVDLNVLPAVYNPRKELNNEEIHYKPIKLKLARRIINDYSKKGITKSKTIYCICDGTDVKQTMLLGCSQLDSYFSRTSVYARGCVEQKHAENNMTNMMNIHIANVGSHAAKVETKVTSLYELYGHKLKNLRTLEDAEDTGSVLVEASWNTHEYNIPQYGASIKMMLQVVVGHENSLVYEFYQELNFIYSCLKLFAKGEDFDELKISSEPLDVTDIYKSISDILNEVNVITKPNMAPNNIYDAIRNIKQISLTDKIWSLFKRCQTINDMKFCFQHLFDTVNDTSSRIQIFEDDKNTMVGKMIADIYAGKMIVPSLSSKQSLELFVELGLQKLKKNYFSLIRCCDFTIGEQLLSNWNKIGFALCATRRGTFAELNLAQGLAHLRFLFHIHILLEFVQLVEEKCSLPKDVSLPVIKCAYNKYITEKSFAESTLSVESKNLCDLVVPLNSIDIKLLPEFKCNPIKLQIRMTSNQKNSSVVTMFHYAKKPIFPENVPKHEDLDESANNEEGRFYLAQLETYTDKIY